MSKEMNSKPRPSLLSHPFIIILAGIVITYGGYLFGVKLYELLH
jgi:hypothetical protein